METPTTQRKTLESSGLLGGENDQEIISLEEAKQYLGDFGLADERILNLKNNLIGIIDHFLHSYLEGFK